MGKTDGPEFDEPAGSFVVGVVVAGVVPVAEGVSLAGDVGVVELPPPEDGVVDGPPAATVTESFMPLSQCPMELQMK